MGQNKYTSHRNNTGLIIVTTKIPLFVKLTRFGFIKDVVAGKS